MNLSLTKFRCIEYSNINKFEDSIKLLFLDKLSEQKYKKTNPSGFCIEIKSKDDPSHRLVFTKERFDYAIYMSEEKDIDQNTVQNTTKQFLINDLDKEKFAQLVKKEADRVFGAKKEESIQPAQKSEATATITPKTMTSQGKIQQPTIEVMRNWFYQKRYTIGGLLGMGILGSMYLSKYKFQGVPANK